MTMLETKGAEYATGWPTVIARRFGVSAEYVIIALNTVTNADVSRASIYRDALIPEVGALTPNQAKAVCAEVQRLSEALTVRAYTNCRSCGLPLRNGECQECA